jgi:large subunit ribosomal protein L19e
MDTSYQKRLASRVLKTSPKRIKVAQEKDIEEALTRNDVKHLIVKGLITKKQKKGTTRTEAKLRLAQKKKGRSGSTGTKKGTRHALKTKKESWMNVVRAQRKLLKELRDRGQIDRNVYGVMYKKSKGGEFRNRKHMLSYLKDKGFLKGTKKEGVKDA